MTSTRIYFYFKNKFSTVFFNIMFFVPQTGLCPESSATPTGGSAPATPQEARAEPPQPRPLPMPEYGGFFALLTEYLPDNNQPISGFHRFALQHRYTDKQSSAIIDASTFTYILHV